MKEPQFRHYYHLDDANLDSRYLKQTLYCAYAIRFAQVLKQDVSSKDQNDYDSEVHRFCLNNHDWKVSVIPLAFNHYIFIPVQLTQPVVTTYQHPWARSPRSHHYIMKFSGPSLKLASQWSSHRNTMPIGFAGYMNEERKDLFFNYARCAEYCNVTNGRKLNNMESLIYKFLNRCELNAFILQLFIKQIT